MPSNLANHPFLLRVRSELATGSLLAPDTPRDRWKRQESSRRWYRRYGIPLEQALHRGQVGSLYGVEVVDAQ